MELKLNPVKPKVRFDGEEFLFESLVLEQRMNSCHRFEVVKEFRSQDEMWKANPEELIGMIGSRTLIYFEHLDGSHPYEFSGWVTDVQIDSWEDYADYNEYRHRSNKVRIIGRGDVVSLDGTPTMNSYIDKQLSDIVAWTTEKARFPVKSNPKYKGILPYAMQYGESNFEFLNRLSYTYGELFYYDGRTLFFGAPDDPRTEDLYVDQDLVSLRTYSSAVPRKYTAYGYLPMEDEFVRTPECFEPNGENSLLKLITSKSDRLFPDKGVIEAGTPAHYDSHFYDMADNRRADAAGRMLNIEGETRTCRIKLGGLVHVIFPQKMNVPALGIYRITQLTHYIDKNGNYSNRFFAMPNKYEYVPERFEHKRIAYPEVATVLDNNDPRKQGRVQVQFYWQKPKHLNTNWLRVQTPDAGSSDKVSTNRGFVSIPEIGDQVMVGFEHGDPHRPFVMGSMFHGKAGTGGDVGNKIKSLSTRSGNRLELNDEDGSVSLTDPGSARLLFDGKGNASTNANKTHTVNAGNKSSINVGATKEQPAQAVITADADGNILLEGKTKITIQVGENRIEISKEGIITTAADGNISTIAQSGSISIESTSSEALFKGSSDTKIGGGTKTYLSGGKVEINS